MDKARSDLLGKTDVKKALMTLAVPATIAMIVMGLYNLVDTIFVGQAVGEDAIGGLSIAYPIQMIILAFALMIGIGSASIFSRAYGRKDKETMHRAVNTALIMGFLFSAVISLIGFFFLDDLLILFGAVEKNFDYAKNYLTIIFIGLIPFSLQVILNNLVRAEGRAKVAMISMIIGAGANIILDPIFIFDWGLDMGVEGAALATVIARILAFIYVFFAAISKHSKLDIKLKNIYKIDLKMFGEISSIGFSSFFRNALGAFLVILINNLIRQYAFNDADTYQAMFGIINRLIMFLLMPGFGLIQGLQPLVGYNYGAKFHKRLYDVIAYALKLLLIYFGFIFILTQIFASQLFGIFVDEPTELLISIGPLALRVVALAYGIIGFQIILSSVYQAMGYPVRAFLVAASRQFILFIPLVFLFTNLYGVAGIWLTFFAADLIASLASAFVFSYEMKDLHQKVPSSQLELS